MIQPFKLVDELGRYQAMTRMDWSTADKENARMRELGNGRRWVPDHDVPNWELHRREMDLLGDPNAALD